MGNDSWRGSDTEIRGNFSTNFSDVSAIFKTED